MRGFNPIIKMNPIATEAVNLALQEVVKTLKEYVAAKSAATLTPDELLRLEDEAVLLKEIANRLRKLVDRQTPPT